MVVTKNTEGIDVHYVGKIDSSILESEFGTLQTDDVVLTDERKRHIKDRHIEDYDLFESYSKDIIENPDVILKDGKNENTVFMIKHIEQTNMNIIIKLAVLEDNKPLKNSIMTAYRIRDKNVKKLEKNNKILYKRE